MNCQAPIEVFRSHFILKITLVEGLKTLLLSHKTEKLHGVHSRLGLYRTQTKKENHEGSKRF